MILPATLSLVLFMLGVGLLLAFVRMVRGPSVPDRILSLDLMASLVVGIIAVYSILTNQPVFLDPAIILSLIAFLGTVAFARYIEKGGARRER
jgi:multicomponent Na+:H+ antiporter subunit F